jgi:hypothetical protein
MRVDAHYTSVVETRPDTTQESNQRSQQQSAKQFDAITHTAGAYAATSL